MEILPKIEIIDLALYIDSTLVIADVHIGYEEVLNRQGVLIPRLQLPEMAKRLEKIFGILKERPINTIVVNGDLKHEFGTISEQEWRNTLKFIDLLAKHCKKIILIKGNHDTILGPIARKREVEIRDYYIIEIDPKAERMSKEPGLSVSIANASERFEKILRSKSSVSKILITHGDKITSKDIIKNSSCIVIGHEHPAISLKEGPRTETFKCFLKGKFKGKHLIVQPSFNNLIEGTDILRDKILSPFLKQNLGNFDVFAVEDKVYNFGKLKNLR